MLLAFSRDASASTSAAVTAAPRLAAEAAGGKQLRPYPPSGILPFQGMASYLAPLCYLYEQPAAAYRVFAAMYGRYWCRLHTLNVQPAPSAGLPVLCRTFLELLQVWGHEHMRRRAFGTKAQLALNCYTAGGADCASLEDAWQSCRTPAAVSACAVCSINC